MTAKKLDQLVAELNAFDIYWYMSDDAAKYKQLENERDLLVARLQELDGAENGYVMCRLDIGTDNYFLNILNNLI